MFSPEELEKTRQLLELFGSNNLAELSISEEGGFSVDILAGTLPTSPTAAPLISVASAARLQKTSNELSPLPAESTSSFATLDSPMVGIFYAAAAPGDPPFVNVGDTIAVGQTIGLIEAMKVFSEIPAQESGRVVEIIAVTGTLVQQSEPLFRIEPQ